MRVKRGVTSRKRHKKLFQTTKGYRGPAKNIVKRAKEAWLHAGEHMYTSRKRRKRDFRALWITRIKAACVAHGTSYSQVIGNLTKNKIGLNRKMLSEIAIHHKGAFESIVKSVSK